jgi:methylated-DNA-[protein]-cysteine S-methyltransferase
MKVSYDKIESPIGTVHLAASERGLVSLGFDHQWPELFARLRGCLGDAEMTSCALPRFTECLHAYFGGEVHALDGLPVDTSGTPFQTAVWRALRRIPAGYTCSYSELSAEVGIKNGSRAVAGANAANPVSLVIPCHRVIRSSGELSGYAGHPARKRWLLCHEGAIRDSGGLPSGEVVAIF